MQKKLHLCTDFNSSTRITVYVVYIYVLTVYLKYYAYEGIAIFFSLRDLPLPGRLSSVPVSHNFFNNLLAPRFVRLLRTFVCQLLCCVPLHIQTFYQNIVLFAKYHVDCSQTLQWRLL